MTIFVCSCSLLVHILHVTIFAMEEFAMVCAKLDAEEEGQNEGECDVSVAFTMQDAPTPKGTPLRLSQLFEDPRILDLEVRNRSPPRAKKPYREFPSPGGGRGVRVYPARKRVPPQPELEASVKRSVKARVPVAKARVPVAKARLSKEAALKVKRKKFASMDLGEETEPESPPPAPAPEPEMPVDGESLIALLQAAMLPEMQPMEEVPKVRKAIVDRPALQDENVKPWLESDCGSRFHNIWKQIYCRNATSEFKLSPPGLRAASALVNPDGKLINGKHWRFDEARTMEHLQRIIDSSTLNGAFLLYDGEPFCVPLIIHLVVAKMFKARGYQIRANNNPLDKEYEVYENTRKATGYVETGEVHAPKAGRSAKDRMAVDAQKHDIKLALDMPVLYDVPPMSDIIDLCRRKLNMPAEQMIEAARGWRWGEAHTVGSSRLLSVANVVAMYCSLSNKARSFGLTVGPVCDVPLPMGPAY